MNKLYIKKTYKSSLINNYTNPYFTVAKRDLTHGLHTYVFSPLKFKQ